MFRGAHAADFAQADGRFYVTFTYVLDAAVVRTERGPLDAKTNLDALLDRIGNEIEAEFAAQEIFIAEREAAESKLAIVLDDAVKGGKISVAELAAVGVSGDFLKAQAADAAALEAVL